MPHSLCPAKNYTLCIFDGNICKASYNTGYPEKYSSHKHALKSGDTITVHVKINNIGFSINDTYLVIAFDNIDQQNA